MKASPHQITFVLLLAAMAAAQPQPQAKARIEGSVVSSKGDPIPRVTLRLTGQATGVPGAAVAPVTLNTTSDDAGKFVFENIEPGRGFIINATRPGFVNTRYGARSSNSPGALLTLDRGADLKGLTITMIEQGVISGKITDQAGDPVPSAFVALMRRGYQRGVRQLVPANTFQTNDQGEYRMASLAPGRYYLVASDRSALQAAATASSAALGNVTTFYPTAADVQAALPIDVAPGTEQRGIDIRLNRARMFKIRGKLEGVPGDAANVAVQVGTRAVMMGTDVIGQLSSGRAAAVRAPDYTFEVPNLVAGTYLIVPRLQAIVNGTSSTRTGVPVEIVVNNADVNDLVVPFTLGAPVTGKVTAEGDLDLKALTAATQSPELLRAAAEAGVILNLPTQRASVSLVPIGGIQAAGGSAQVSETGTFTMPGVAPGRYQVNFGLPPGVYVKSARFGGEEVRQTGIDLTSGRGGELTILLSNKAADLTGAVRDDKQASLAGLMVTLWTKEAEASSTNGIRTTYTDQAGGFEFRSLPPGEYFAAAWEEVDTGLVQSRDFLAQFLTEAGPVTLGEAGRGVVEAKLIPIDKIRAAEEKLP